MALHLQLSLKWHPDKWYAEGGAFEGIEPADVLVDDADAAKVCGGLLFLSRPRYPARPPLPHPLAPLPSSSSFRLFSLLSLASAVLLVRPCRVPLSKNLRACKSSHGGTFQVHFYKLSRAHEVLTDEEHRRLYDESLGDGGEALERIRAKHGPSWGAGCQNAAYGCQGTNIVSGLEPPHINEIGTFGSAASCLEACEKNPDCHAYAHYTIGFQAQGSDASTRPKAGKCYMRRWLRAEITWQPLHEPHVTSGFCPGAARKHAAEKYGKVTLHNPAPKPSTLNPKPPGQEPCSLYPKT